MGNVLLALTKTIMRKIGLNLWVLGGCAIILCAVFSGPKVVVHHGMTSEMMGIHEFPANCGSFEGGFAGHLIAGIPPNKEYAINSVFITAAGLGMNNNNPVAWADSYYGDPSNYGYNRYDGTVDSRDLFGWWGSQTFSPMAPIMPDFCLIGQSMENECRALLLESGGGLSAICTLKYTYNEIESIECEYTMIDAGIPYWYSGMIIYSSGDDFMYMVQSYNLYLVDSN